MASDEYLFQYTDTSVKPTPAKWVDKGTVELEFLVSASFLVTLCIEPALEDEAALLERSNLAAVLEEHVRERGVSAFDFDEVELTARYVPAKGK